MCNKAVLHRKLPEHFYQYISRNVDISEIDHKDVPLLLEKIEKYGSWLRLSKMTLSERNEEIFNKSKKLNRTGFVGDFLFKLGHLT